MLHLTTAFDMLAALWIALDRRPTNVYRKFTNEKNNFRRGATVAYFRMARR